MTERKEFPTDPLEQLRAMEDLMCPPTRRERQLSAALTIPDVQASYPGALEFFDSTGPIGARGEEVVFVVRKKGRLHAELVAPGPVVAEDGTVLVAPIVHGTHGQPRGRAVWHPEALAWVLSSSATKSTPHAMRQLLAGEDWIEVDDAGVARGQRGELPDALYGFQCAQCGAYNAKAWRVSYNSTVVYCSHACARRETKSENCLVPPGTPLCAATNCQQPFRVGAPVEIDGATYCARCGPYWRARAERAARDWRPGTRVRILTSPVGNCGTVAEDESWPTYGANSYLVRVDGFADMHVRFDVSKLALVEAGEDHVRCTRTACRSLLDATRPYLTHRDTGSPYCQVCARLINQANGLPLVATSHTIAIKS